MEPPSTLAERLCHSPTAQGETPSWRGLSVGSVLWSSSEFCRVPESAPLTTREFIVAVSRDRRTLGISCRCPENAPTGDASAREARESRSTAPDQFVTGAEPRNSRSARRRRARSKDDGSHPASSLSQVTSRCLASSAAMKTRPKRHTAVIPTTEMASKSKSNIPGTPTRKRRYPIRAPRYIPLIGGHRWTKPSTILAGQNRQLPLVTQRVLAQRPCADYERNANYSGPLNMTDTNL